MNWKELARIFSEVPTVPLTKLTKAPSDSYVSTPPGTFQKIQAMGTCSPAMRARLARQAKVEAALLRHPDQMRAFDVTDTPVKAEPAELVSVVLAVRHGSDILSGELRIPRERWDAELFLRVIDASEMPQ